MYLLPDPPSTLTSSFLVASPLFLRVTQGGLPMCCLVPVDGCSKMLPQPPSKIPSSLRVTRGCEPQGVRPRPQGVTLCYGCVTWLGYRDFGFFYHRGQLLVGDLGPW